MNQADKSNLDIINEMVSNHFSLDQESLKMFKDRLYEPVTDPIYRNLVGDDLRIRYPVSFDIQAGIDSGWITFKKKFGSFCLDLNVDYRDFNKGRVLVDKNVVKLQKALLQYYVYDKKNFKNRILEKDLMIRYPCDQKLSEFECKDVIKIYMDEIDYIKIQTKGPGIQVVLSLNFADWFLCSTGESWTSCLNLESDYHGASWSGLPGLIGDPNRIMLYITDGRKKEWNDIIVDKMLSRTWVLLDEKDIFNTVRYFPNEMIASNYVRDILCREIKCIESTFVSKHPVDYFFFQNEWNCFIHQDYSYFDINKTDKIKFQDETVFTCFNKQEKKLKQEHPFSYSYGLKNLIIRKKSIEELDEKNENEDDEIGFCSICEAEMPTIDMFYFDERPYCVECFNERFFYCNYCNNYHKKTKMVTVINRYDEREFVCKRCIERNFTTCKRCLKYLFKGDIYISIVDGEEQTLCYTCASKLLESDEFSLCLFCRKILPVNLLEKLNSKDICKDCLDGYLSLYKKRA